MNIRTTITKEELRNFYIYGEKLRDNPCRNCRDCHICAAGCPKQRGWRNELESLPITSDDWEKYENVRKYTEATLDLIDVVTEVNNALKKQAELRDQVVDYYTKFEVVDE